MMQQPLKVVENGAVWCFAFRLPAPMDRCEAGCTRPASFERYCWDVFYPETAAEKQRRLRQA
jgi:hypothetical protein